MLVLIGTAVACAAVLRQETAGPPYGSLAIALSFGPVLVAIVAGLGQVSGAHVNPAVTLGLASAGKFPWRLVPSYIIAQLLGGLLAAVVVWGAYGERAREMANLGAPAPVPEPTALQGLLVEALIAFRLVFTVVAVATDPRVPEGVQPLAIGFALAAGVLLGGPVSGGASNPARALGPMIVAGSFGDVAIYVVGPIVGAIVAALLYDKFIAGASAPTTAVASEGGASGNGSRSGDDDGHGGSAVGHGGRDDDGGAATTRGRRWSHVPDSGARSTNTPIHPSHGGLARILHPRKVDGGMYRHHTRRITTWTASRIWLRDSTPLIFRSTFRTSTSPSARTT